MSNPIRLRHVLASIPSLAAILMVALLGTASVTSVVETETETEESSSSVESEVVLLRSRAEGSGKRCNLLSRANGRSAKRRLARQPFGNISIAGTDAASDAMTESAIEQAYRAIEDLA